MRQRRSVLLFAVLAAAVFAFGVRPAVAGLRANASLVRAADVVVGADTAGIGAVAALTPAQRDGNSPQRGVVQLAIAAAAIGALGAGMWSALRQHGRRRRGRYVRGRGVIRAPPALMAQLTLS